MIDAINTIGAALSAAGKTGITSDLAPAQNILGGAQSAGASQSFSEVMGKMATDVTTAMKSAETVSLQGIRGQANTREVVDAVMNAEQSLQTAIAIRDKVVSAYLDITRMAI